METQKDISVEFEKTAPSSLTEKLIYVRGFFFCQKSPQEK